MWRCAIFALSILSTCVAFSEVALAEKRVALVIGNSAYKNAGELPNPKNDATDMAAELNKLGFEVVDGIDLDKAAMDRKIRDFAGKLANADIGLFFYAGHGLQVGGVNYLVPVDAQLITAAALDFEMIRLDLIQRTMERESKTNILFLDACRDNPLARNLARAMGTRGGTIGRGLAAAESGVGTLISYSTQPGNVALDGDGRNSPFAGALVKMIAAPGDDLSTVLINVRRSVMSATNNQQVPWEHSALTGRLYFAAAPAAEPEPARPVIGPTAASSEAARAWETVQGSDDPATLTGFRKQFGAANPFYDSLAASRLEKLKLAKAKAEEQMRAKQDAKRKQDSRAEAESRLAVVRRAETSARSFAQWGGVWDQGRFGDMRLLVSGSTVTGDYDWRDGRIDGTLAEDGKTLTGIWRQSHADPGKPPYGVIECTLSNNPNLGACTAWWGEGRVGESVSWNLSKKTP